MDLLGIPSTISWVVYVVLLAVKIFAFVSSLLYSAEHYRVADKWSKGGWVAVTGIAALLQGAWFVPMFVNLALTIATFVYLADVRPALAGLRRR